MGAGGPEPGRAGPSYDRVAERYAAEIAGELTHKPLDRGLLDAMVELARPAAADMTALPLRAGTLAALVCLYAVIHLDPSARAVAYREFARVLQDGGRGLIAFHTSDP